MKFQFPLPGYFLLFPALFLLSGCLEVKDEYVLNPDGSGKVRHEAFFQNLRINIGGESKTPDEEMKEAVEALLTQSKGVDVWKEVSYELGQDGRIHFIGTAYFQKLEDLKFKHGSMTADVLEFSWEPQPDGSAILTMKEEEEEEAEVEPVEDIETEISTQRAKYLQMKPMMMGMMGGMKAHAIFRLPARPTSVSNFQEREDGRYEIAVDGGELMESINNFIMDDERIKEMIVKGKSIEDNDGMDQILMGEVFGTEGPVRVVIPAAAPRFDYEAEVQAAREAFPAMVEALDLAASASPAVEVPVDTGAGFEEVRVAGTRMVRDTGSQMARPFNWTPGYTISLAARLGGRALSVTGGSFEAVETLEGTSLLGESDFQRDINRGSVSEDGRLLVWECQLEDPGDAKGLKRIAGTIEYMVAEGVETIDLGFEKLAPGEKGKAMNAVIRSIETQPWGSEEKHVMELKLTLVPDHMKEMEVLGEDGRPLPEIHVHSRMTSGEDDTTLSIRSDQPYPENGKVRVVKHANLKKFRVPFEIENVDLLGRPLD
jgi:hypothetical protein